MPNLKAHTLPSRTSRHSSQNLTKSVLFPTLKEIQFFFSFSSDKIKTLDTQINPTKDDETQQRQWFKDTVDKNASW